MAAERDWKQVLLVGNSHAEVVAWTHAELGKACPFFLQSILLNEPRYNLWGDWEGDEFIVKSIVKSDLQRAIRGGEIDHVTMMIGGASHFILGAVNSPRLWDFVLPGEPDLPITAGAEIVPYDLVRKGFHREELEIQKLLLLAKQMTSSVSCMLPPPPVADPELIVKNMPDDLVESAERYGVPEPIFRYKLWQVYTSMVCDICAEAGILLLPPPPESLDEDGFLRLEFSEDSLHGNEFYGSAVIEQLASLIDAREPQMH